MTELTLSIFDPNTLLPHRAGIAGLALALSVINPDDVLFSWEVTEDAVKLSWDCSDRDAILSLMQQTYQIRDGYLDVPALNLDPQGKYTFTKGVVGVFLQHQQQRTFSDSNVLKSFQIDEGQPEITVSYKPLVDCYYTKEINVFTRRGQFNTNIEVKSQHLPGLEQCFIHGSYKETHKGFLSLLFLPLACSYFQLPFVKHPDSNKKTLVPTYAIVIPEVTNILAWSERRTPSTIYGFLLSLVGESDLTTHLGVKLAMGIIGDAPPISRILRKQRHHKFDNGGSDHKKREKQYGEGVFPPQQFAKPNFQELLTDLKVVIKLDSSQELASIKLSDRVAIALSSPEQITRFGGLSLGESWAMINGIRTYRETDGEIRWLVKDNRGLIGLPIWIDRTTTRGTFERFSFGEFGECAWIEMRSPVSLTSTKKGKSKPSKQK